MNLFKISRFPDFIQYFPDFSLTKIFKVRKSERCGSLNPRLYIGHYYFKNTISKQTQHNKTINCNLIKVFFLNKILICSSSQLPRLIHVKTVEFLLHYLKGNTFVYALRNTWDIIVRILTIVTIDHVNIVGNVK